MGTNKQSSVHPAALPPPYQLAIEDAAFRMTVLENHAPRDHDSDCAVVPPIWFSVTLTAPVEKRYLYLVQKETDTGLIVVIMLFDRSTASAASADANRPRLPPAGGWLRAVVDGTVFVLASDLVLGRKAITAWIGGREPPTMPPQPPYT